MVSLIHTGEDLLLLVDIMLPPTRTGPSFRRNAGPLQTAQSPTLVMARRGTTRVSEISAAGSIVLRRKHLDCPLDEGQGVARIDKYDAGDTEFT